MKSRGSFRSTTAMLLSLACYGRAFRSVVPSFVSRTPHRIPVGGLTSYQSDVAHSLASFRLFSDPSGSTASSPSPKKRVAFLGTPDVAAVTLRQLYEDSKRPDSAYDIVSVITQPPKRRRRKGKTEMSPVGLVAEELGIPVLHPEKARDKDFLDDLEQNVRPDLCITAAYGQFLPKRFLAAPTYGTVNIHPSLLPRWRGASPVQRSLEAGDNPVGVSVLFTVSKMDAGPIISQKEEMVDENDTATTVLPHLFNIGTACLIEAMPGLLSGEITMENTTPQDESAVVDADRIDSAEAEFRPWKESARDMHNRLRGFSMWPGAFVMMQIGFNDKSEVWNDPVKYKILETRVLDETVEPTRMVTSGKSKKSGLRLVCYDGSVLEIVRLQPPARKAMDARSYINGLKGLPVRWTEPEEEVHDEQMSTDKLSFSDPSPPVAQ